jgi:iron complex outermembrane receptor protein
MSRILLGAYRGFGLCRWVTFVIVFFFSTSSWAQGSGDAGPPGTPPVVTPPTVLTHVDAVYPPSALAAQRHTDVVLTVTVDADGHVSNVEVTSSGGDDVDQAAELAVRQWTFVPAKRDGRPIASRIRVPFHFAPPAPAPEVIESPPPTEHELPPQPAVSGPPAPRAAPSQPASGVEPSTAPATEVTVYGRAQPPSRGASDFTVRVGELALVPRKNASDLLTLAPGIFLSNEGGEGHAEQVFLRGFDAREGQDVEFSVGGVPINESGNLHGNGYADTHFIIPELVKQLRVLEGPFDPRQGNYAVAGSADYELGLDRRGLTAKYTLGSFGTERLLLLYGPAGQASGTFGGAELFKTNGFGQNRDAERGSAMGQYEGRIGELGSYRVTATAYATSYHSAGVIREDDYLAGRVGFFDTLDSRQGGDASRFSVAGDVQTRQGNTTFSQQLFVIDRAMRLRENFTGFLLDVQEPLQTPHPQRGDLIDLEVQELTVGARGSARLAAKAFDQSQELEFGYFARGETTRGTQQRVDDGNGHPYATETDLESKLGDIGLYLDANVRPASWLSVRGGLRGDLFTFDVNNLCAVKDVSRPSRTNPPIDESCLSQENMGRPREPNQRASTASTALLPRVSVLLGPFQKFTLSASYGQGVRSIDPSYITQDVKTPFASIQAYEAGLAYAGSIGDAEFVARSVLFQTKVDRDLIFDQTAGRNIVGVGTTRTGWVGAARITTGFLDESANVTLVRSKYEDTGLAVAYVPGAVLRSDTALFRELPFTLAGDKPRGTLGFGVSYVGPRPLPYGQKSQSIFTVDASAAMTFRHYELGLTVANLLDNRYRLGEYNYPSSWPEGNATSQPTLVPMRQFTAGAPRAFYVTFGINFGGTP